MKRLSFLAITLIPLFCACNNEDSLESVRGRDDIRFAIADVTTRAMPATKDNIRSMAMFCYTGDTEFDISSSTPNYNFNDLVSRTSQSDNWTYAVPAKGKWDKDKKYHSFFAFSPFAANHLDLKTGATATGFPRASYTMQSDVSQQVDLLYAAQLNTMHYYMGNRAVSLNFRHALSKISIKAALTPDYAASGDQVIVKSITFSDLYHSGELHFTTTNNEPVPAWDFTGITPAAYTHSSTDTPGASTILTGTAQYINDPYEPLFLIPQQMKNLPDGREIKMEIAYSVNQPSGTIKEITKEYSLSATGMPDRWEPGKGYEFSIVYGGEIAPTLISCSITDWDDQAVNGDITPGDLVVSKSKVVMDYARLGNSFSTFVSYTSSDPVTVEFEYDGITTTDGSNFPGWLPQSNVSVTPSAGNAQGKITMTYVPTTETDKKDITIRFKTGDIQKSVKVIYDNGFLPKSVLAAGGWDTNQPANGVQLSKRGNNLPAYNGTITSSTYTTRIWGSDDGTDSGNAVSVPGAQNTGFGYGMANTQAILASAAAQNSAAAECANLGKDWYLPSIDELYVIGHLDTYLGDSYIMRHRYWFWSSSQGSGTDYTSHYYWDTRNPDQKRKMGFHAWYTVRCVRNQ